MGFKCPAIIFALFISGLDAVSQDSTLYINFEAGSDFIGSKVEEKDYLREFSNRNSGIFGPRIISEINKFFAGVKLERKTANGKFGFSTGLRFTHLVGRVTKSGVPDFFYVLFRQTGTTTEYLEVKQLTEISNYLGIPVEVYFYVPGHRTFRFYFMAGSEWSYQLSRKTEVVFTKDAMDVYESDVGEIIGEPERWYGTFYARPGFVIGKNRPVFSCGLTLPVVISNSPSSLNTPIAGMGFQIQFHLPFKKNRI